MKWIRDFYSPRASVATSEIDKIYCKVASPCENVIVARAKFEDISSLDTILLLFPL